MVGDRNHTNQIVRLNIKMLYGYLPRTFRLMESTTNGHDAGFSGYAISPEMLHQETRPQNAVLPQNSIPHPRQVDFRFRIQLTSKRTSDAPLLADAGVQILLPPELL